MTEVPDIIRRLRDGKRQLRRERVAMSLPEKIREVVKLQRVHVTIVGRRRSLKPLERVWPLRDE
ncbi:MAG TPA: hypothetical protein VF381_07745 [Thermoanaerobaculia bacterium]